MLSRVGSRLEAATGPLNKAPTQGAAAGLLRESGDDAAATASAVKFMLIESEAAATSASFLPAQFSRLFFLLSSQPIPPPQRHARTAPCWAGQKSRVRGRNNAGREGKVDTLESFERTDGDYDT